MTELIPNSDFLGRTYDVVTMDPTDLGSTSKKKNVIDISVAEGHTVNTRDGFYTIPAGVLHTAPFSMHWETTSTTISSSYEFQKALKVAVDVDAGVEGGFEFSASASSNDMEKVTQSRKRTYVYSRAYQENHMLDLDLSNPSAPLTVTQEFQDAVLALPLQDEAPDSEKRYQDFIDAFGTHFSTGIVLGGLAIQRTSGLASTYLKSTESEQTLQSKAKVEYEAVKGGAGTEMAKQEASRSDQESNLTREYLDFRGGQGSTTAITDQWIASLKEEPAIVKAKLERLSYLLTSRFFPKKDNIGDLQGTLDRAITDWIQTRGRPSHITAPLRYGEPVVIVFPWADRTKQIGVIDPASPFSFGFQVKNGQPYYDENYKVGLRILSGDGSNMDGVILAGDQVRIESIDKGFLAFGDTREVPSGKQADLNWTNSPSDAARFNIFHREDNLSSPGRLGEYFQESDLVAFVPVGQGDMALCLATTGDRSLTVRGDPALNTAGFYLVRCAEEEDS